MARRCELTGKGVMVGNNVSHAKNRTRRRFLPNLQMTSMLSDTLGKTVSFRAATSAIRSVEKRGGIDAFLLNSSDDVLSRNAKQIKRAIMAARADPTE